MADPFTFENISDANVFDSNGEVMVAPDGEYVIAHNDTWFRVKLKITLKKQSGGGSMKQIIIK